MCRCQSGNGPLDFSHNRACHTSPIARDTHAGDAGFKGGVDLRDPASYQFTIFHRTVSHLGQLRSRDKAIPDAQRIDRNGGCLASGSSVSIASCNRRVFDTFASLCAGDEVTPVKRNICLA